MAAPSELTVPSPPVEHKHGEIPPLPQPVPEDPGRILSSSREAEEDGDGECHTPTSKESRIPATTSCPPAPKKCRRISLAPSKPRPSDLELIRVGPELMHRLLRRLDAPGVGSIPALPATKKRKRCYPDYE